MTPNAGWSLEFNATRRLGGLLSVLVVLVSIGAAPVRAATYDPRTDANSMAATAAYTGAQAWWTAGYTGSGVDVAIVDSGVSPVQGLSGPNKLVYGPDLSLESQSTDLSNLDTFGHGTFMAGLIAGHDDAFVAPYALAPASAYRGMAPDARIVSLKVATADGGADVSQVIAAIDWVVQHRADNGLNIRVLNLSYGTNSTQAYGLDPLAFAVEQAWKAGIVVVAAGGNSGYQKGVNAAGLADPAYDPYVIAVGASDSNYTSDVWDDSVATFSAAANGCHASCRYPDLIAPGAHLQGLRVPGSYIDQTYPEGILDGRFVRGSGTSESAAITSGAVALILQKNPSFTPDQTKSFLLQGAAHLSGFNARQQGYGEVALTGMLTMSPAKYGQTWLSSNGTGSLELSRGTDHLTRDGVVLSGEKDIFGMPFEAAAMAAAEAAGSSWSGGVWNGSTWSGSSWSGSSWSGSSWSGSSWSGSSWSGNSWSGSSWSGNSWSGSSWSGNSWSGSTWSSEAWK